MRTTLGDTLELDVPELFGEPRATLDSDEFVMILSGSIETQPASSNHIVVMEGDRATCQAYTYAWHTAPSGPGALDEPGNAGARARFDAVEAEEAGAR